MPLQISGSYGLLFFCILMDFLIQINVIRMALSILLFKGSRIGFPNYDVFKSLKVVLTSA